MKCVDIPEWLKGLPVAPEFRPTDTEFADPIAYISKIEKEASAFGICKVVPPLPKPSKKYVLHNLKMSLSKCPDFGLDGNFDPSSIKSGEDKQNVESGHSRAVFTTRHQELGHSEKKKLKGAVGGLPLGAQKQVWQSGQVYTLEQFETKSKNFARNQLGMVKEISPFVVEAMFWKLAFEEPIYVEYANDVPGSAFGEPEGLFNNCRRRKRAACKRKILDRNSGGFSRFNNDEIGTLGSSVDKGLCHSVETPSSSLLTPISNKYTNSSTFRPKGCGNAGEMEGSAGWKLANSPWNLQVIARSPGSLTRFMPDDIPGVTSPMVYIGMLFSWFAWHVEDHELHSLNFLHTGSPKTWYAVPGDCAFGFEEVIRCHAYGETTDRLAALALLGEKTTLLSPEVLVASGIPCCRLVQNPGEFVVTFPRAYHVGFSHGFNCGEAANFGTPQWLAVAKEAAVRRAAMNYLPMLSHQQLLYLLTMSFVSSVPRSLLPGVRSSRMRGRQKEEREFLVKKAFIEDIEKESNLVKVLLQKSFADNAMLWDVDMLPSSGKESGLHKHVSADASRGNSQSDNDSQDLLDQMSLYMENYSDFYVYDDVSCEFEIDSGTLPCIACGILGFPFMALVQPSEKSAKHLFPEDFQNKQDPGVLKHVESDSHSDHRGMREDYNGVDRIGRNGVHSLNQDEVSLYAQPSESAVSPHEGQTSESRHLSHTDNAVLTSKVDFEKECDVSRGLVRPRIFCLEHAIQTEELLRTKGGANVLVICHSDFQKIRGHAAIVAEEIDTTYKYNEIPLANASQGHLSLIDLAMRDEEQGKCAEDWTLKLNINLRHCVKVQRNCPLKKLKHALILGGLFSDTTRSSDSLSPLKWQSRKVRSKRKLNNSTESTPFANVQIEKVVDSGSTVDMQNTRNRNIRIQYSRKKYKRKACSFVDPFNDSKEVLLADAKTLGSTLHRDENAVTTSVAGRFVAASDGKPLLRHEHEMLLLNRDQNGNLLAPQEADLLVTTSLVVELDEAQAEICTTEKFSLENKTCITNSSTCHTENKTTAAETSGETEITHVHVVQSTAYNEKLEENRDMTESVIRGKSAQLMEADFERDYHSGDDKAIMTRSLVPVNSSGCCTDGPSRSCDAKIEDQVSEQFGSGSEASDSETSHKSVEQEIQIDNSVKDIAVSDHVTPIEEASASAGSLKMTTKTSRIKHSQSGNGISGQDKKESNEDTSAIVLRLTGKSGGKRSELDLLTNDGHSVGGFAKSPCEGLRPRARKNVPGSRVDTKELLEKKSMGNKVRRSLRSSISPKDKKEQRKGAHRCNLEGCWMSFQTKVELQLHKHNRCPIEGCEKKFTSHKYAQVHQRVHENDRPLKCPWKGCTMTFKWAWARTEHLRVHTGERPYKCKVEGCGLTFRFVSDYSRHRRKTGHYVDAVN
ncbi:putative lysine-specific demethylase ELF6 isoform X1 [Capsicum chacoense]